MNCPTCNVSLVMSDRQGIEIDYCPQCRGVWLDRGELDKIIERSGSEFTSHSNGASRSTPHNDEDEDGSPQRNGFGGQNRRENPLSDLFDFF